ncbi:MAG: 50S ribosomal protein L22 [Acidimicrobiales bacterium]|nr:50S ribosomal protein L22 [Acidimicrobiales bacterium]
MTIAPTHDRPHARCTVKFVRMSASKVRVVMDLIRGEHVVDAIETLALSPRLASQDIAKALRSAVANANHNEEIPTEELYVSACYADEGPTLKRFRPRARGRAGKIMKRTCHITVEVARMTDEEISRRNARLEAKGGTSAKKPSADRSKRVAKSKAASDKAEVDETKATTAAATAKTGSTEPAEKATEKADKTEAEVEQPVADQPEAQIEAPESESEAKSTTIDSDDDGEVNADDASPYGEGSHALIDDDPEQMPDGFEIKGNASSKLYHVPGSAFYNRTKAEVWFASTEAAEAAGFELPPSQREDK